MTTRPALYLKSGNGWHKVGSVIDVKVQPGKFELENGQEVNGDIVVIIMKFEHHDDGQIALRKLREMEPRIVDMRVVGQTSTDMSVILCGDETSEVDPTRYAIMGRVLGFRPIGQAAEIVGAGGPVVEIPDLG